MTAVIGWGAGALTGSALLMVLVLMVRAPVRRLVGPRLAYALWVLPAIRIVLPALPVDVFAALPAGPMPVLVTGPQGVSGAVSGLAASSSGMVLLLLWCAGALGVFAVYAVRHWRFCRRLRAGGSDFGLSGTIRIIAADVSAPLAFGVRRRFIAVPHDFARDYAPADRDLALAHEAAHHARGDLLANWLSLAVLAANWWNPVAWAAMRAFRQDQEFAANAAVLAARVPAARRLYA